METRSFRHLAAEQKQAVGLPVLQELGRVPVHVLGLRTIGPKDRAGLVDKCGGIPHGRVGAEVGQPNKTHQVGRILGRH